MSFIFGFGNRSESLFALALFGIILSILALCVSAALQHPVIGAGRRASRAASGFVFAGTMALLYISSLSGFYEAQLKNNVLSLRYFVPLSRAAISWDQVISIQAVPAYKGLWRVRIATKGGNIYESATWSRSAIQEAAHEMQLLAGIDKRS
ncbi:MAG TPA: hypothetical protein VFR18_07550 [Terriglobia bacterium]|nr:hypothetical protein [Terriglobia bacterium]